MDRWKRFRRLSPPERRLLLRALALLPVGAAGLHFLGFRRWHNFLAKWPRHETESRPAGHQETEQVLRTARLVEAASREGFYRANCLERSLALWWLLRRQRLNGELRIGVRKHDGRFEAHAWVEWHGAVLNDTEGVCDQYEAFEDSLAAREVELH